MDCEALPVWPEFVDGSEHAATASVRASVVVADKIRFVCMTMFLGFVMIRVRGRKYANMCIVCMSRGSQMLDAQVGEHSVLAHLTPPSMSAQSSP